MLLVAGALACACSACRPGCRPRKSGAKQHSRDTTAVSAIGLFRIAFLLSDRGPDADSGPQWRSDGDQFGCQLHVLDINGQLQIAVDLGDARRRTFWPKSATYWRRPALFRVVFPPGDLWLEFHSPVLSQPLRVRAEAGRISRHLRLPAPLPSQWSFSCVLRHSDGQAMAIDAVFTGADPRLAGTRRLQAAQLKADQMRAFLEKVASGGAR